MRTLAILRGLPASGKSTCAGELIAAATVPTVRINRDDLRQMLAGPGNNLHAKDVKREQILRGVKLDLIERFLRAGYNVIADDTHLNRKAVNDVHKVAEKLGDVVVVEAPFNVPVDECIARDDYREGFKRVGRDVILSMAKHSNLATGGKLEPRIVEYPAKAKPTPFAQDRSLPAAIICDLDGTLSLLNGRNPYDASKCDLDLLNVPVAKCVSAMRDRGYHVIFMSGRESKYMEPTERFLSEHFWAAGTSWRNLHMRATGDTRKDVIVKRELFDKYVRGQYFVEFVLDDRDSVVSWWREMGLTCFQVGAGDF